MKKIEVNFENCYGIEKLNHKFEFLYNNGTKDFKSNAFIIYAPNGVMKTSFAKTFFQISKGEKPAEEIHCKEAKCEIKVDGVEIKPEEIYVIKSSVDTSKESEHISRLLVDADNKEKYNEIYSNLLRDKNSLIVKINKVSGVSKNDIERQILEDFGKKDFFDCIENINTNNNEIDFSYVKYSDVFDKDVLEILKNPEIVRNINEYIEKYSQILESYPYFKKGSFNPFKAEKVLTTLTNENFFINDNSINLTGENGALTKEDFKEKINSAQRSITENEELKKIRDLMIAKAKCTKFQEVVEKLENPSEFINELRDLKELRKKIWISYFNNEILFKSILESFKQSKEELIKIEEKSSIEVTMWKKAIGKFNKRFTLPYELDIDNQKSALIGKEVPNIVFKFKKDKEGKTHTAISRERLNALNVLSQGEKRALYLLNIIFEVEIRKADRKRTLFIIDDIADSFDYKNKYAIVQYLKEIKDTDFFYQIILTHNFDFYRTVQGRVLGDHDKYFFSYIAQKENEKINLVEGWSKTATNPFAIWKDKIGTERRILIATIPFIRNLIEFKEGGKSNDYILLTKLLHFKDDSINITIGNIKDIFKNTLKDITLSEYQETECVLNIIFEETEKIILEEISTECINLENKIILSIAIRLKAEEYMWGKVTDKSKKEKVQTGELVERYRKEFEKVSGQEEKIEIFDDVNLMTPENIHLNSFMFEPILDLSMGHLIYLYKRVKALKN